MISLLSHPTQNQIAAILRKHPTVSPLPPLGDSRWVEVLAQSSLNSLRDGIVKRAGLEREAPLPRLTAALYANYSRTGARLPFENSYFERRRRLSRAAIALLAAAPGARKSWQKSFLDKLGSIFREKSWALPAHVKSSSGTDPRVIDLFAAETANLMAEFLVVFGSIIPETLANHMRLRLRRDFFENYLDNWPMFWWTRSTNNWNAVCHQGVLGAALQVEEDNDLVARLLRVASFRLTRFLEGFGSDGGCSEGAGYWQYGFGWFSALNEQLECRTHGELSLFGRSGKMRAIARYGAGVSLSNGRMVNFSDCPKGPLYPWLLQYLGRRLQVPVCLQQARENYNAWASSDLVYDAQRSEFFFWSRFFLNAPSAASEKPFLKQDSYFSQLQVWVVRGRDRAGHLWELAAKGGNNHEHHNHNDVGSFILNIDGVPFISEIGCPEYVADSFGPKRYSFLANRSRGHSVPVINGYEQEAGKIRRALGTTARTGSNSFFEANLAPAYPVKAACRSIQRRLVLDKKEGRIEWSDRINLRTPGTIESAVITDSLDVTILSPSLATIRKKGGALLLECSGDGEWTKVETHAYKTHIGGKGEISRLVMTNSRALQVSFAKVVMTWSSGAEPRTRK
jgi:hypothetical protein